MASDRILKRAVFGGFKRENVIDYIEKIQIELAESQKQTQGYKKKYEAAIKRADAVTDTDKKLSSMQSDYDNLKSENELLNRKNEEYLNIIHTDSDELAALKSRCSSFVESLKDLNALAMEVENEPLRSKILELLESLYSEKDVDCDDGQFRFDDNGLAKLDEKYMQKNMNTKNEADNG